MGITRPVAIQEPGSRTPRYRWGKPRSLLTLISQVETHDAQAAEGLWELAHHYDYGAILRVLEGGPA